MENDILRIKKALENYKADLQVRGTKPEFIQHGKTWFKNWEDWVDIENPIEQKEIAEQNLYDFLDGDSHG